MLPIRGSIEIEAERYLAKDYPPSLDTIGDHLKKKRLDLKLTKVTLAKLLQVNVMTIGSWERGEKAPVPRMYKKIIGFLGYIPKFEGVDENTLMYRLFMYRMRDNSK